MFSVYNFVAFIISLAIVYMYTVSTLYPCVCVCNAFTYVELCETIGWVCDGGGGGGGGRERGKASVCVLKAFLMYSTIY